MFYLLTSDENVGSLKSVASRDYAAVSRNLFLEVLLHGTLVSYLILLSHSISLCLSLYLSLLTLIQYANFSLSYSKNFIPSEIPTPKKPHSVDQRTGI